MSALKKSLTNTTNFFKTLSLITSLSETVSFPPHTRTRPRLEREREYEEYTDRERGDTYATATATTQLPPPAAGFAPPPVGFVDDYSRMRSTLDRTLPRDHRTAATTAASREDEYPPTRSSSRRVLNAI